MSQFLNMHIIQTVAPSNLNRDDTGAPKSAIFGGVKRHRVSSQSWKKAIRDNFRENGVQEGNQSWRTRHLVDLLAKELLALDNTLSEEFVSEKASSALKTMGFISAKDNTNSVLVFISEIQLKAIAKGLTEEPDMKANELKKLAKVGNAFDLALFGRMVASDPELNVEGSVQVAHPISTHAVTTEFDFFVGSDDLKSSQDHAGAAMLGDIEFVSSTLYRFATVNIEELTSNLEPATELTEEALMAFVESFVNAIPSGKQNSFASHSKPSLVLVHISNQPLSLTEAFEKAIAHNGEGFEKLSIERLFRTYANIVRTYEIEGPASYLTPYEKNELVISSQENNQLLQVESFSELKNFIKNNLTLPEVVTKVQEENPTEEQPSQEESPQAESSQW